MTDLALIIFWLIVDFAFVVILFWFLRLPPFDRKSGGVTKSPRPNGDREGGEAC